VFVVDDVLLVSLVAERDASSLAPLAEAVGRGEVFTTGAWFWRVGRAVAHPGRGALSRLWASLPEDERERARWALEELPAEIGLLSLRHLVPVMAALPGNLNLLNAEAVAAARVLGATISVTTRSPLLEETAAGLGVQVELIDT